MCCARGPYPACETEDGGALVRWFCNGDGHWSVTASPLDAGSDADDGAAGDAEHGDAAAE